MLWVYIWLAVIAVCLVIEFITTDLVSVWFVAGALVAMILAMFEVKLVWQLAAFIVISAGLLASCRKPLSKIIGKTKISTNSDSIIGKEFTLITPIAFNVSGSVKVNDVIWTACTEKDGAEIASGERVKVVEIRGNKLIVERVQEDVKEEN